MLTPDQVSTQFQSKITLRLDDYQRVVELYNTSVVRKRIAESLSESIFLRSYIDLESTIEKLFYGLLTNSIRHHKTRVQSLLAVHDVRKLDKLFGLGDNDYLQFLPYRNIVKLANRYLLNGKPFTLLDDGIRGVLGNMCAIRNHIAHNSKSTRKKYVKVLPDQLQARPPNPGAYMMSLHNAPNTFKIEYFLDRMIVVVHALSRATRTGTTP